MIPYPIKPFLCCVWCLFSSVIFFSVGFSPPSFERGVMAPALPALQPPQGCQPGEGSTAGRLCHLINPGRAFPHGAMGWDQTLMEPLNGLKKSSKPLSVHGSDPFHHPRLQALPNLALDTYKGWAEVKLVLFYE